MSARRLAVSALSAAALLAVALACGGGDDNSNDNTSSIPPDASFSPGGGTTGKLGFSTTDPNISALGVNKVELTVTATDISTPMTGSGTVSGDTASGVIADVPAGNDRTLKVRLLKDTTLVAEASTSSVIVTGGAETTVHPNFPFPSSVLINEIGVNTPYMELYNKGSTPVNVQGWKLNFTGFNPTNPTFNVTGTYTFPAATIPAGGYLVLNSGAGTDTATDLYYGSTIMWTYDSTNSKANKGSARITDAAGKDVDFVCWVQLPVGSTPTEIWSDTTGVPGWLQGMSIGRTGGADTNKVADWTVKAKSKGAANP